MANEQAIETKTYYNAMQVSFTTQDWTVIVQVVQKHKTELAKNKLTTYKKYVLTDMQGTLISAITFKQNVDPLDRLLLPFRRYEISNADLNVANPQYKIGEYGYEWVLTVNHLINEIPDAIPHTLPCTFRLAKFSELAKYADRNEYINIKALVVGSLPVANAASSVQDYIIVDQEKIPMVLRLWEDFFNTNQNSPAAALTNPTLVIGLTLKVNTFHGLSLASAMYNTCFLVNPPTADAKHMHEWYKDHKAEINLMIANKSYEDVNIVLPPPNDFLLYKVKQITGNVKEFKAAWVNGTMQLMPGQDKLWQSICSNCSRYFKGKVNWSFTCISCKKHSKIIARGRMEVYLTDDTGTLAATVYSPHFEKICGFTGNQIYEADIKGQSMLEQVQEAMSGKKVYCFVKFYAEDKNYSIPQLYLEDTQLSKLQTADTNKVQLTAEPSRIENEAGGSGVTVEKTVQQKTPHEPQFFTPSLKAVLDETANSIQIRGSTSDDSPAAKRNLMFGTISAAIPETISLNQTSSVLEHSSKDDAESPVKKSKKKGEK